MKILRFYSHLKNGIYLTMESVNVYWEGFLGIKHGALYIYFFNMILPSFIFECFFKSCMKFDFHFQCIILYTYNFLSIQGYCCRKGYHLCSKLCWHWIAFKRMWYIHLRLQLDCLFSSLLTTLFSSWFTLISKPWGNINQLLKKIKSMHWRSIFHLPHCRP